MYLVIKRNGSKVDFDEDKIYQAVFKAAVEVGHTEDRSSALAAQVCRDYIDAIGDEEDSDRTVEDIQDSVENILMREDPETAKAYILYRYQHEIARRDKKDKESLQTITEKLMASNVQNQNANVDEHSFGGRIGEVADEVLRQYALDNLLSPMAKSNHLNNEIYIHDLSHYAVGDHNCLTIPFDDLLANGFNTRQTDVRPANSINTAFQLVAVLFQLQSLQQFGGASASHIDWTMVPYVRKSFYKHFLDGLKYVEKTELDDFSFDVDKSIEDFTYRDHRDAFQYAMDKTKQECHQAVEGMYHNLNTLQSRSGNQLPFTSLNYGTCTLPEGRMVTKALLDVSIEGLGRLHKTSIFPCGIFQCMNGVNRKPEDPNYDLFRLALKSTAQRLYPNYVNVDWSVNEGYDPQDPKTYTSTMGKCKL